MRNKATERTGYLKLRRAMSTAATGAGTLAGSATLILDLEKPLPKSTKWKYWVIVALGPVVVIGLTFLQDLAEDLQFSRVSSFLKIALGTIFGVTGPPEFAPSWLWLAVPLIVLVLLYLVVAVHEAGHVAAGFMAGLRFNFVLLWPFFFTRERNSLAIRREKGFCSVIGAASMLPEEWEGTRIPLLFYVLSGPAANLMCFACLSPFIPRTEAAPSYALYLIAMFANLSFLIGTLNLLPFRIGALESDGARILMIAAVRPRFERWLALLRLAASVRDGVRPQDLDALALQKATMLRDDSGDFIRAHLFAYSNAAAQDRVEEAASHLENCLRMAARLNPVGRAQLMFSAATFHGWYKGDAIRAKQWFEMAQKPGRRLVKALPFYGLYPQIAIAWAEGRPNDALTKSAEATAAIQKLPDTPTRDMLLADVAEWREKMEKRLAGRAAAHPA